MQCFHCMTDPTMQCMHIIPTKMLETLNVLKSGDWVEELYPHRTQDWPPVKEEQVAAAA